MPVKVQGLISDVGSGVDPATVRFSVTDEYGIVQPAGPIALAANGTYAVDIPLLASRQGNDRDGRRYTIVIRAKDFAGNEGSTSAIVNVPHDQK